jgi:hypothetical protein
LPQAIDYANFRIDDGHRPPRGDIVKGNAAMKRLLSATAILLATTCVPARADPNDATVFYFAGACEDCQGTATGELVLTDGYVLGTSIDESNFMAFRYAGTNLQPGFTILADQYDFIGGEIDGPLPGPESFDIFSISPQHFFESDISGSWCAGSFACNGDMGSSHTWSVSDVPEPATWTMMLFGFAGLSFAGYRARAKPRFA